MNLMICMLRSLSCENPGFTRLSDGQSRSDFLVLVFKLHVFVAKKCFPVKVWYLCVAQLFRVGFQSISLLKMVIHMA